MTHTTGCPGSGIVSIYQSGRLVKIEADKPDGPEGEEIHYPVQQGFGEQGIMPEMLSSPRQNRFVPRIALIQGP